MPIALAIVLNVIYAALLAYMFIVALRIVLGWFSPGALGPAWRLLIGITDPYLNVFSRIRLLRSKVFDFSPVVAILLLVVVWQLVRQLLDYGRITLGFFLAAVLSAAWSGAQFVIVFFLIVGVLRTIPMGFRGVSAAPLWRVVDMIIQPVVGWVQRLFRLGPRIGYTQHLLLTIGLLLVTLLLGEYIIRGGYGGTFHGLAGLLESLPI